MKIKGLRVLVFAITISTLLMGCRSEFERVRMSAIPELKLEKGMEYYEKGDYIKAQTLFEGILSPYRGRPEAEELFFKYAYTFYRLNQYMLSAHYFSNFASTFAYSEYKEEAEYMSAYSNYKLSPGFRLDQGPSVDAIQGFQDFVNAHPNSERVSECNKLLNEMRAKLEQKAIYGARLYYDLKEYKAAIQSFENMLREFPDTDKAEEIQFLIVSAALHYGENSIFEKRQERYEIAMDKYWEFVKRYPSSKFRKDADAIYQKSLENLTSLSK